MSEYIFGLTKAKLSLGEAKLMDRICRAEGGNGYTQLCDSSQNWIGYFTGPDRGELSNLELKKRVSKALARNSIYVWTGKGDLEWE